MKFTHMAAREILTLCILFFIFYSPARRLHHFLDGHLTFHWEWFFVHGKHIIYLLFLMANNTNNKGLGPLYHSSKFAQTYIQWNLTWSIGICLDLWVWQINNLKQPNGLISHPSPSALDKIFMKHPSNTLIHLFINKFTYMLSCTSSPSFNSVRK